MNKGYKKHTKYDYIQNLISYTYMYIIKHEIVFLYGLSNRIRIEFFQTFPITCSVEDYKNIYIFFAINIITKNNSLINDYYKIKVRWCDAKGIKPGAYSTPGVQHKVWVDYKQNQITLHYAFSLRIQTCLSAKLNGGKKYKVTILNIYIQICSEGFHLILTKHITRIHVR